MIKRGLLNKTDQMPLVLEASTGSVGESCAGTIDWVQDQRERIEEELHRLKSHRLPPSESVNRFLEDRGTGPLRDGTTLAQLVFAPIGIEL